MRIIHERNDDASNQISLHQKGTLENNKQFKQSQIDCTGRSYSAGTT